jgi:bifunctional DNA-binding transcriptional regulator/antitoxin component of YhaV-PrlF toxin-antitoxin module
MRMTCKGQVTIPKTYRSALGWGRDTNLSFSIKGNQVVVVKAPVGQRRGAALVEMMTGKADTRMSTKQILSLMRG